MTLYVPRTVLLGKCRKNEMILFEQERPKCLDVVSDKNERGGGGCQVELVDTHVINGTTPDGSAKDVQNVWGRRKGY